MAGLRDFQQGSHCHRKTWINILLGILQLLLPCVQHGGAQMQALSQMSTSVVEVWQAEDADPLVPAQVDEEQRNRDGVPLEDGSSPWENGRPLRFQPPALEFGTQPLGLPRAETIYIHNPSQELPVTLLAMFTSSRHFHMPSFHRRVIPPRGKASFKLVFLPTEEGDVENSLFINTSAHGVLSYQVFGVGVRQGSLKAQRKDSRLLFPHIQSIKLTQTQEDASNITILGLLLECSLPKSLFSSAQGSCLQGGERLSLQISLAERSQTPAGLDKLKPYVTEHILVLLAAPDTAGEPKIAVYMLNSGGKKLYVKDMQVLSKVDASLEMTQALPRAETRNFTQVATLACRGSMPGQGRRCSSHISLQVLGSHSVHSLPGLHTSPWGRGSGPELSAVLQLRQRQRGGDDVEVWLTNPLRLPLTLTHASLAQDSQGMLKVVNFSGPVSVPRAGCWPIVSLQLLNKSVPVNLLTTLTLTSSLGPALRLPLHLYSTPAKGEVVFGGADGVCGRPCPLRLSEAGRAQWQRSLFPDSLPSSWAVDSQLARELCSRWQSRKDQLPCRWPRLPVETSSALEFGATPVNESKVKRLVLKNPSSSVVSVEIRALSLYPAPLDALDILTKWFNISPLSVNISTTEFTLLAAHPKDSEGVSRGEGVLRLLLQPWETRDVAVVFTPSEHKPTTTILLIRNNLTVFDMVTVQGHGAKELLRVGGKLPGPGASLRFNVPQSTLMECRDGLRTNKPLFAIRKSFKVENAGELPLTVISMNINGYKCQGFGFEVLQCRSFSLDHNSSSEITIAFTPDFTSSWVIRDLTLVTSRGSSFPFTLNVTLPHHMLPLCAQAVPGPSWEETFWVVTLVLTCFSLLGVCLMAFHQAQFILTEFSSPAPRGNHNSVLSRDNGPPVNITPNGVNKMKGSCKTYVDTCHTSDKGKGRGSPAVANGPAPRPQSSSKKGSSGSPSSSSTSSSSQPQKKHKVSVYYTKYSKSSSSSVTVATVSAAAAAEEREDLSPDDHAPDPDVCVNNNNNNEHAFTSPADKKPTATTITTTITTTATTAAAAPVHFKEAPQTAREDKGLAAVMFPVETPVGFPDNMTVGPGPRPGLLACSPAEKACPRDTAGKTDDIPELEPREEGKAQRKKPEKTEPATPAGTAKGKKSRRKTSESVPGAPEHSVVVMSEREKEPEWRTGERNVNGNRAARSRCANWKPEAPKPGPDPDSPLQQNGACQARPRRKCAAERRCGGGAPGVCESGSDSGSSSGSVRASRGSWGSWSSASSVEGDKDASGRAHHCTATARKRDSMQYSLYPAERDCYQNMNSTYKAQSVNSLCRKEPCQSPDPPLPSFTPSFAAVAAGVDRNMDLAGQYLPEETWSAPSVPLTNEFRYNASEALPYVPQAAVPAPYNGFPWSNANSQCNSPYDYCNQGNYMPGGNANFQSSFPCQESQSPAYSHQASWSEECPQEGPSAWDTAGCVGSKPYFPGTRSLSPMSSLFGSIWTPQSEPYQNHFQPERSAPISPVSPVAPAHTPFSREPGGSCRVKQYSSFNPFGPHMNLDIWNSSSNRSSNSQLSSDSGYCGDV